MKNRIKRALTVAIMVMALMLMTVLPSTSGTVLAAGQPYVFTSIDFPGATFTKPYGINASGDIVGQYDKAGKTHGFLLQGGVFTTIDFPGAVWTQATAISPSGDIVGIYIKAFNTPPAQQKLQGFLLTREGEWILLDYPGEHIMTGPYRILPDGSVVGCVHDVAPNGVTTSSMSGFVISPKGNYLLDEPFTMHGGATPDRKTIVGYQMIPGTNTRGYVVDDGTFIPFKFPESIHTMALDINPAGVVVGGYTDSQGLHGFLVKTCGSEVKKWGEFTPINFPGITGNTRVNGINAGGDLVGHYIDATGTHGFLATHTQN